MSAEEPGGNTAGVMRGDGLGCVCIGGAMADVKQGWRPSGAVMLPRSSASFAAPKESESVALVVEAKSG